MKHCILIALLFEVAHGSAAAQPRPLNPVVKVNFSTSQPGRTSIGVVAGLGDVNPLSEHIQALNPDFWRVTSAPGALERARHYAPITQLVLSDYIGYPVTQWQPGGGKPPYADWDHFENRLRFVLRSLASKPTIIDVWNEPDHPRFWHGTQSQFFETYLRAYRIVREVLGPHVLVGGPSSFRPYNKPFLTAFLEYCLLNGCEVNSLSWHELDDSDAGITAIADHIKDARSSFVNNTRYAPLKIQRIDLNEFGGPFYTNKPGPNLMYLDQLERGGADAAARTCWNDSRGASECFNDTLAGLLDSGSQLPRPNWWLYRYFSAGRASRVRTTSSDFRIVGVASAGIPPTRSAEVLIGYVNSATVFSSYPAAVPLTVYLDGIQVLSFLNRNSRVAYSVEQIPDLGEGTLAAPKTIYAGEAEIKDGKARIELPVIIAAEAYRIVLSAPR